METLNIVDLLEKNPVTRLSSTYNNKLINTIKETFTETQQKFFTSYFYCYLNYNQETDYVIDLDSIWEWLGFSQKSRATDLLEKKFIINKDYKHISNLDKEKGKGKGGHNKKTLIMTIKTFKLFCLKSGTEKADEICDYFIKMQELLLTLGIEQNNELRIQLEKLKNESNKDESNKDEPNKDESNKDESNKDESNKDESNKDESNNDETNNDETNNDETNNDESNDDESSDAELNNYQPNLDEYKKTYNYTDGIKRIKELKREKKRLLKINKLNENGNNSNNNDITNKLIKELINKVENLEKSNKEIISKLNPNPNPNPNPISTTINTCKTVTNFNTPLTTLGPRLQQINPDTLKLVKVYESVSELIAESNNKLKRPTINKAVVENTVYHGYRYLLVDRELDANIITHIEPTKKTKIQNTGYIAQINKDKTEILNVYLDRKTAAKFNGYESSSALDIPVKNYTINRGHFYKLYDECEEDLREDFVIKNDGKEPFLYKEGVGRFDADNNLIDEFACKFDCIKSIHISDKTLAKALENKQMYNNFYYRYLDGKLKC